MRLNFGASKFTRTIASAAAFALAGCGALDPGVTHHAAIKTEFALKVSDLKGAPVQPAQAHCRIFLHRRLLRDTTLAVSSGGECAVAISIFPDTDAIVHHTFETRMTYTVTAPEYVPASGEITHGIPLYSSDLHPDVSSTSASQSVTMCKPLDFVDERYAASLDESARASLAATLDTLASIPTLVQATMEPRGFQIMKGPVGDTMCGTYSSAKVFNSDKLTARDVARAFFVDGYMAMLPTLFAYAEARDSVAAVHAVASCFTRSFDDRSRDPHTLMIDYIIPSAAAHEFLRKKMGEEEFLKSLTVTADGAAVALESR